MTRAGLEWRRCATRRRSAATSTLASSRSRSTRPSSPPPPAPSPGRSRRTACGSATASACCRWKAGTAPRPESRPSSPSAAGATSAAAARSSIWGGEAVAVRHDGRANPRQLLIGEATWEKLARLREALVAAHEELGGRGASDDLVVGLQITHSGRNSRPNDWDRAEPLVAWNHPLLDTRYPAGVRLLRDEELDRLVEDFVPRGGAREARRLRVRGREALPRLPGPRAALGALARRPLRRSLREPHALPARDRRRASGPRPPACASGCASRCSTWSRTARTPRVAASPRSIPPATRTDSASLHNGDLDAALGEARELLRLVESLGVRYVCTSAGSPYYNPHLQRPALFPPSDGYLPARRPARRRRPPDRGDRAAQGRLPRPRRSWARPTATCRSGCPTSASGCCARDAPTSWASGAWCCPTPSSRRDVLAGPPARQEAHLPHIQRLHHGAAQGAAVGLLPARPLLR